MNAKKVINQLLLERNMDIISLAAKLEIQPQSLRNKINRESYSLSDFLQILDILECDLQVVTRDTKRIFD